MTRRHATMLNAAIIIAVFVIDRMTKVFFMTETPHQILPSLLDTTTHRNFGLIANLPLPSWIILAFTMTVLAVIGWKLVHELRREGGRASYALSFIAGGALGNLFDRLTLGYVFDWILFFNRSVMNVADIAISIGIGWYMIQMSKTQTHAS
ncbi:MAG: signal peptidase II [Patescibacteria group bacterium]